jgi:hypothetical protein
MLVPVATRPFGRLPGLHDVPDHWSWIPARLAWLPAFALVLAGCRAAFRRFERNR